MFMNFQMSDRAFRVELSPVEEATKIVIKNNVINLASGSPDPRIVPIVELRDIAARVLEERGFSALSYPNAGGQDELKSEIKKYMHNFGIKIRDEEDVIITSGAQHALKMIADAFIDSNKYVFVENPTFYETLAPFKFHNASIVGVSLDTDGLNVSELEKIVMHNAILYVIPTCHNPTGFTMDLEKRKQLMDIAFDNDLLIIEDDPYRPIADGTPPPLKSFDNDGRVLYVGSFSKVLAPGLRVGWVYGPKSIINRLALIEQLDFAISTFTQYIVLEALRSGLVSRLVPKLTNYYKFKMSVIQDALSSYMPSNVEWTKPKYGFFLLIRVKGMNMESLLLKAVERGVVYVPARKFYVSGDHFDTARLSISVSKEEDIRTGVRILASLISS
jgi:DNA-binding transcriptional MocR family regulator